MSDLEDEWPEVKVTDLQKFMLKFLEAKRNSDELCHSSATALIKFTVLVVAL